MTTSNIEPYEIHILLVDDDEIDVENVRRCFSKNNLSNPLHVACDGQEALDMLEGANGYTKLDPLPKVILLDINMPRLNGLEFLEIVRTRPELDTISIFMLTTSDSDRDIYSSYEKHVAGYIVKPVDPPALINVIQTLGLFWSILSFPR